MGRGFSGYNSTQGLAVLPRVIPPPSADDTQPKVRLVTVFFGANDACLPGTDQHVDLQTYTSNLEQIICSPLAMQHNPAIKFLIIGPPPLDQHQQASLDMQKKGHIRRTAEHTKLYADAAGELADKLNVPYVNTWEEIQTLAGWKENDEYLPGSLETPKNETLAKMLYDGLHLSGDGYQVLFKALLASIKQNYPELDPENLSAVAPFWDDAEFEAKTRKLVGN
ncbi:hypothetical protein YB2330_001389 [Saitoella coloradoensis]